MSVNRFKYAQLRCEPRFPLPGELIRSTRSNNYINLVISITTPVADPPYCGVIHYESAIVTSVRYAELRHGKRTLLLGKRARRFQFRKNIGTWRKLEWCGWEIVEELCIYDNTADIAAHMKSLEGVNLLWQPVADDDK